MGVFAVIDKEGTHYSNIYGGASMPFMQRLTMSGVAMHSGMVTGRPASHGCIRLPHPFAIKLYKLTGLGARVIIAPNAPAPEDIVHARLFVKKPVQTEPLDMSSANGIAVASATDMTGAIANARVGKITAERAAELQKLPISILVSKAEGKVVVRHGFRQVLEAPGYHPRSRPPARHACVHRPRVQGWRRHHALAGRHRAPVGAGLSQLAQGLARLAQRGRAALPDGRRAPLHGRRGARPHRAAAGCGGRDSAQHEHILEIRATDFKLLDDATSRRTVGQYSADIDRMRQPQRQHAVAFVDPVREHRGRWRPAGRIVNCSPANRASNARVVSSATTRPPLSIAMRPHSACASSR